MIGIIIVVYNLSDLIRFQVECIKQFCKDEFEIIVIDNSDKEGYPEAIKYHSTAMGCKYIKTNSASSNGSESHTFACNLAYTKFKDTYQYILYLDHDNFPIKDFSVKQILTDKIIGGLGQGDKHPYFWAGCVMFDNFNIDKKLIDFSPNHDLKLDTGGNLFKVVENYGLDKCVFFNEVHHQNPHFNKSFYNFYSMINDGMFMHFVNASNWNNSEDHTERINSLINILQEKVNKNDK